MSALNESLCCKEQEAIRVASPLAMELHAAATHTRSYKTHTLVVCCMLHSEQSKVESQLCRYLSIYLCVCFMRTYTDELLHLYCHSVMRKCMCVWRVCVCAYLCACVCVCCGVEPNMSLQELYVLLSEAQ